MDDLCFAQAVFKHFRYCNAFIHNSVPKSQKFLIDVLPNLSEDRFRQIARVSWRSFLYIYELIKDDILFQGPRSSMQLPIQMQLLIVLYRLGSSGEGASISKIAFLFGIGDGGTLQVWLNRIFYLHIIALFYIIEYH